MISRYGMSLKGDSITPEQASAFFATIVRNGRENADALRTLNEEIVANDRELARLRDVAAERKGTATGDVVVVLNAKKAGPSDLRLTYCKSHLCYPLHHGALKPRLLSGRRHLESYLRPPRDH
jgi:hypothetical protein